MAIGVQGSQRYPVEMVFKEITGGDVENGCYRFRPNTNFLDMLIFCFEDIDNGQELTDDTPRLRGAGTGPEDPVSR